MLANNTSRVHQWLCIVTEIKKFTGHLLKRLFLININVCNVIFAGDGAPFAHMTTHLRMGRGPVDGGRTGGHFSLTFRETGDPTQTR